MGNIYGIELTDEEISACDAWLTQEESKTFYKIVDALVLGAERNGMNDPSKDDDFHLFAMQRERYLGERKGLRKILNLIHMLRDERLG